MLLNPTCRRFISVYLNLAELCMEKNHVDDFPATRWNHFSIILLLSTSHNNMLHFHSFSVFAKTLFMFCTRSNNGSTVEVAQYYIYNKQKVFENNFSFCTERLLRKISYILYIWITFPLGETVSFIYLCQDIQCFLVLKLL